MVAVVVVMVIVVVAVVDPLAYTLHSEKLTTRPRRNPIASCVCCVGGRALVVSEPRHGGAVDRGCLDRGCTPHRSRTLRANTQYRPGDVPGECWGELEGELSVSVGVSLRVGVGMGLSVR